MTAAVVVTMFLFHGEIINDYVKLFLKSALVEGVLDHESLEYSDILLELA